LCSATKLYILYKSNEKERYSCCSAALQLAHSRAYSTAWECVRKIGSDSFSELPGIHLGTSWTVRIAMLMYYKEEKKKIQKLFSCSGPREPDSQSNPKAFYPLHP
jgi:hypothetical protein